jgi:Carboxypeptidase regulatory-like domain
MKVLTTTPFLSGAPGEAVTCRVRIENDGHLPSAYQLRVVGFDERNVRLPTSVPALPAGGVTEVDVELFIPEAIAPGNHAVGVEVRSDRSPDSGSIAAVTVSVGSLDRLLLTVNPSTVRGNRTAKFWVDVLNRDREPVELELGGDATDGEVRVKPRVVRVEPNQRVRARGRVTGPIRLFGEPRQLPFTVSARGRTAPIYARATYQQRPLLPRSLRTFVAVLLAISLWAGALGVGLLWWTNRGDDTEQSAEAVELVDVDGDGVAETPADQLVDTDSDGVPDTPAAAAAEEAGGDDAAKDELPTFTLVNGTVKAGETGQNDGVLVTLTPITLGTEPSPDAVAFRGAERATATKLWPARYGVSAASGLTSVRQTETLTDLSEGADGAFVLPDVLIRQTYEINFAKPGFDSQSYVVTPTADGEPVEMEIVLEPSDGALGGLVTGGGGALGNVAIDATDGTLQFATTTASEGTGIGRFSLPAVNTPATYTITATLRGYGTEVIQVPLSPGEQQTDLSITMRPGVGSIIGRVTSGGAALGGATLTVSNGDDTRTTTSLTDGDVGLYNFPQLEIPGTYTVTASSPGYITQTRLVDLAGNVTGVDFDLTKTTATITGIVASDVSGPLPGAAIDISRDSLNFTASSAAAPQPGAFSVDDLPPGTYLVRFSRFDHAESSQLVTLTAGQVFDLGTITLTFTGSPELPSTGSINVDVVDSQGAPLNDATVRILDVSTRAVVAEIDGDANQSSFIFQNVPVGTYTVQVERRLYRVSERRVSVGLGPQSVTVQMFLLGQVSGRLIDSLTNQQLTDFEVSISRVNSDGTLTLIERVTVGANAQPDALTGRIEWESSPNSLTTGTYRVEVTDAPPGYRVVPDQILDPNRPAAPVMEFEITPTQEDPIQVNDIEADIYPTLTGRIYKPLLTVPDTNTVGFARVDDQTLVVLLDCPGAATTVTATLTDTVQTQPGFDTYTINPVQLEQANASGNCTLTVSATGFATTTDILSPPLEPTDGVVDPDQIANVAIVLPAASIGGRVEWVDARTGTRFPIDPATITTDPRVIVDFQRAQGTDIDAEPVPVFTSSPLTTTSLAGTWLLDGQIFGRTRYTFSATNFQTGSMFVTIDETDPRGVTAETNLSVVDQGAGDIRVTMTPVPGALNGQVSVASVNPVRYTDFTVTGTSPDGNQTVTPTLAANGAYSIPGAAAGTWTVATATNNGTETAGDLRDYLQIAPPAPTVTPFVGPAATVNLAATRYVERPRFDISVVTVGPNPAPIPGATITIERPGVPGSTQTAIVGADGRATFRALEFNQVSPTNLGVQYQWSLTQPGFDTSTAVTTFTPNGAQFGIESDPAGVGGSFVVVAGAKPSFRVALPRFGTITADVVGRVGVDPTTVEDVDFSVPGATIRAFRVAQFDANGILVATAGPVLTATLDPQDPSRFTVSGPPGAYVFDFTHPDFAGVAASPLSNPPCGFVAGCYLLLNNQDPVYASPFELNIKRVAVEVTVLTRRTGGSPIANAGVTLQWGTTGAPVQRLTNLSGQASFVDLLPGTTNVDAVVQVLGIDTHFPVIASIDLARFSATPGGTGLVHLTIVMPELGRSITGTIRALNSENDPIHLPAQVEVTRTYAVQDSLLDGADVDNQATESVIVPTPPPGQDNVVPDPLAPSTPQTFSFDNVAGGVHTVTLSTETGYQTPTPNPITVPLDPTDPLIEDLGTQTYRANDIAVVVNVFSDDPDGTDPPLPDATVRLASPDPDTLIPTTVAGSGVFSFAAVPPELTAYTLSVTHPLHATFSTTVDVIPSAGPTITVNVTMTPARAVVTGTALKDAAEPQGGAVPLVNEGAVSLFQGSTLVAGPIPTNGSGVYAFTLANPDRQATYTIEVRLAGHTTEVTTVSGVRRGRATTAGNVTVYRTATVNIAVSGIDAADPTLAVSVSSPPGTEPVTVTRTGLAFAITGLDPLPGAGQGYRFSVSASGFFTQEFPSATTVLDPLIGATQSYTAALVERKVTVTVVTSPSVPADEQSATVELRIPSNGAPVGAPTRVGNVYTFGRLSTGGTGLVTVTKTGYRTQTAVIDVSTTADAETVTLFPLVDVTGTVTKTAVGVNAANVSATNGTVTRTATTNASGVYSLADLDVGTWTITAEAIGYGTGSATTLTITPSDPAATATRDIALTSRNMTVTATVQSPSGTALSGATVTVAGVSQATTTAGTVSITVSEAPTLAWTITATGKVPQSGTITVTSLTESLGTRVLADLPALTGVVRRGGNTVNNANVFLCPTSVTTCTSAGATRSTQTDNNGVYTFATVAIGSYKVGAAQGNDAVTSPTTATVNADGTTTPTPFTIDLTLP